MVIYVASPHPQESKVFCQETCAFSSADLHSGRKIELMTQDILYFIASDFQSGSDDTSHLRGKARKEKQHTPTRRWTDDGNVLQLPQRLPQHLPVPSILKCTRNLFSVPTQKTLVLMAGVFLYQMISENDISNRKERVHDFRKGSTTAKISASVAEAPGSDQYSVQTDLVSDKI